jgi:hypothetical protein
MVTSRWTATSANARSTRRGGAGSSASSCWVTFRSVSGPRDEARLAARYLAEYIGKDFADHPKGLHRYDVAEGFQPRVVRVTGRSWHGALDTASGLLGPLR